MLRIMLRSLFIILVLAATATSCTSAPEFKLLSRDLFENPARDAAFFDGGTILAAGGATVVIPDGTRPEEGILVLLDGEPMDIVTTGSTAWIAVKDLGLVAIDLSDPARPVERTIYVIEDANSCAANGRFLMVGGTRSGLYLFDISDPDTPSFVSSLEKTAPGAALAASDKLFAAAYDHTVILMAVGDSGIKEISRLEAPSRIARAELAGTILHLLSSDGNVYRYNVSKPRLPEPHSSLPENNISDLCTGANSGLALLKTGLIVPFPIPGTNDTSSEPRFPDPRYSLIHGEGMTKSPSFPGTSIRCSGDRLIIFGPVTGFHFYRLGTEYTRAEGEVTTRGFALDLVVIGEYIYLANGRDGLRIGRVAGNGSVEWTGHVPTTEARDIAIEGDILVMANGMDGVKFFRNTVPDSPVLLSTYKSPSYLSAVRVQAGRAYLAGGFRGIEVVDFTDPASPVLVWREDLSEVRGVDVDDGYLYVADGFNGFRIYSLAGDLPELISTMDTPGWASDLFISGDILHIADGQRGFMTIDVSDHSAPKKLGRIETGALARTIHARGDIVFIATQILGITAIDISNPGKPTIAARYKTVNDARGIFADDRFVYLASGSGGLYIFRYEK